MRATKSLLLGALASLGLAGPGFAQESVSHVYAGATFGQAHWRAGCLASSPSCDDTDRALRVFGGYQINRILAAEVGYHNLGKATGSTASVKGNAWEALVVAAWPITGGLSAYGKLGGFRGNVEESLNSLLKLLRLHIIGITAERSIAPRRISRVGFGLSFPTQLREVFVTNPMRA